MSTQETSPSFWARLPVSLRAIVGGILIGLSAANVWPLLVLSISGPGAARWPILHSYGVAVAAAAEVAFLALYLWWAGGAGWPRATKAARRNALRVGPLSAGHWVWGLIAAVFFAATVHSAIVLLFRFVPFPAADFRAGYSYFTQIPTAPMRWLAVVISALSAGVCEETGFRGYMQRPIEQRHGAVIAILISSFFFMLLHLNKGWATIGMVPIVFGAGALLGSLAWASRSLVFCMIGHTIMDIGLFGFWWTGIAGDFNERTISVTGMDQHFMIAAGVFAVALLVTLAAITQLRRLQPAS